MSAKRYSKRQKGQIVRSINEYNRKHGRGGVYHAKKKFGITFKTLAKWLEAAGKKEPSAPIKKKKIKKPVKKNRRKTRRKKGAPVLRGSLRQNLNKSLSKIDKAEKQIAALQAAIKREKEAIKKLLD